MTKKEMIKTLQVAEARAWKEFIEAKSNNDHFASNFRSRWMAVDTLLSDMKVPRFTPNQLEAEGLMPDLIY